MSRHRANLRYVAYLMGGGSLLALLLASLGLHGVIAYAVVQLTHEIGIRVTIGATRLIEALPYEIDPLDRGTFMIVVGGLSTVALVASYLPARRAARVDPVHALRHD